MSSEQILQQTAVAMLRVMYPDLVLNLSLNGISLDGLSVTQRAQLIRQAKLEGMENGIQDLSIYLPECKILNLEFKRPKGGVQSPDQILIESKLNRLGHNYHLVRSVNDVFKLISHNTKYYFREEQYTKLNITSDSKLLTNDFLYFKKGTELRSVKDILVPLYYI